MSPQAGCELTLFVDSQSVSQSVSCENTSSPCGPVVYINVRQLVLTGCTRHSTHCTPLLQYLFLKYIFNLALLGNILQLLSQEFPF